jgi:cytochrome c biogenesis protein CcmG/thiol:disulfide interchange protein DsbE
VDATRHITNIAGRNDATEPRLEATEPRSEAITTTRRGFLVLGTAVAAAAMLGCELGCDRGSHPEQLGEPAPLFHVADGSHSANLSSMRGHVVLLNFWATWCAPCIEELPSLAELTETMPALRVIAISVDEDADAYQRFLATHRMPMLVVRDPNQTVAKQYGSKMWPESYLIDQQGRIRRKFVEPEDWMNPEIVGFIRRLIVNG